MAPFQTAIVAPFWSSTNTLAQSLLNDSTSELWQTSEPFSTEIDAQRAESALIKLSILLGREVVQLGDNPSLTRINKTNISSIVSSRHIVPAVYRREGTVSYEDLEATAIVSLRPEQLADGRGTLHGARTDIEIADRARESWPLNASRKRSIQPRRLLARLKGSGTILGEWDLNDEAPTIGDAFNLVDAEDIDPGETRGMRLDMGKNRLSNLVTWSKDIRASF